MPDTLNELYDQWRETINAPNAFQCFQAGFTLGAVKMRERAMAACENKPNLNDIKNKIGALPDIP